MKFIWLTAILALTLSCNNKIPAEQEVLALKEMNDLATVEYVVTKIIKTNDDKTWYKFGDRKILMSCQASVKAGIDFSLIDADHIKINGEEISVELPRAKMLSINMKPEDINVEYEEVGFLRQSFSQAEKDHLLRQGENSIKSSVASLGVIETAETNAAAFVTQFLKKLGYKKISVTFVNDYNNKVPKG